MVDVVVYLEWNIRDKGVRSVKKIVKLIIRGASGYGPVDEAYNDKLTVDTTPVLDDHGECLPGVLNQKGIQEQIRDILEGGRDAFELRRKKYIRN